MKNTSLKQFIVKQSILNLILSVILLVLIFWCVFSEFNHHNLDSLTDFITSIPFAFYALIILALFGVFFSIKQFRVLREHSQYILNYLNNITYGIKLIGKGNYDHKFDHGEFEEINDVITNLNDMLENLNFQYMRFKEKEQVETLIINGLEKKYEKTKENLDQTEELLIRNEKFAALGELVSGITHEMKTPIGSLVTVISYMEHKVNELDTSFSQNSLSKSDLKKFITDMADSIKISTQNIYDTDRFIDSLKKTSISQLQMDETTFNVASTVDNVVTSLKLLLKNKDIKVNIQCDEDLNITSYQGALSQILMNLISNAIKHGFWNKDSGTITIKVEFDNHHLSLHVIDDGVGVHPDHINKLFDPFFTTAKDRGGTGLGLSIIYNLINQLLLGTIHCKSSINVGTEFIIRYPILDNNKYKES